MSGTQQALLTGGIGNVAALDKAAVSQAFPGSTFNTSSATYVNLLNGSGGAAIQVTLQKGAGTQVLIAMGMTRVLTGTGNVTTTLGVNDGTSDTDVSSRTVQISSGVGVSQSGEILIAGLAAATYTFTARIKTNASMDFTSSCSAFIRAWEVT